MQLLVILMYLMRIEQQLVILEEYRKGRITAEQLAGGVNQLKQ